MQYHQSSLHLFFFVDVSLPVDEPSTSSMANHPPRTVSSSRLSPIIMESPIQLGPSHNVTEDVEAVRHARKDSLNPTVMFSTIVFILIYILIYCVCDALNFSIKLDKESLRDCSVFFLVFLQMPFNCHKSTYKVQLCMANIYI